MLVRSMSGSGRRSQLNAECIGEFAFGAHNARALGKGAGSAFMLGPREHPHASRDPREGAGRAVFHHDGFLRSYAQQPRGALVRLGVGLAGAHVVDADGDQLRVLQVERAKPRSSSMRDEFDTIA